VASLGLRSRTPINRFGLLITTRGEQPPCVRANGSPLLALRPCPFRSQNNVRAPASFGGGSIDHGQLILGWDLQRRTGRHLLQNLLHLAIRARIVQDGETRRTESCALLRTHRAGRAGSKIGTRFRIIGIPRQRPAPWHSASGQAPPWRELVSSCRSGLKRLAIVKPSTSKEDRNQGGLGNRARQNQSRNRHMGASFCPDDLPLPTFRHPPRYRQRLLRHSPSFLAGPRPALIASLQLFIDSHLRVNARDSLEQRLLRTVV
jgi:hypothetical protein